MVFEIIFYTLTFLEFQFILSLPFNLFQMTIYIWDRVSTVQEKKHKEWLDTRVAVESLSEGKEEYMELYSDYKNKVTNGLNNLKDSIYFAE